MLDTLLTASSTPLGGRGGGAQAPGNPHVQAIQSRVAELVRRYDESVGPSMLMDEDEDEEDDRSSRRAPAPGRWRVGDLLLSTHAAMAKSSARTDRAMAAEFPDDDDPEVAQALGGEAEFAEVIDRVAHKTEHMRAVLEKTMHVVKHLQDQQLLHDEPGDEARGLGGPSATHLRDLKITVEALHKEKSMILGQLHEHVRAHKDMLAAMDEQNQELKKAQIALGMKDSEVRGLKDDFAGRLAELQKMAETSQQNVALWRDKYQGGLKTIGDMEQRVLELERRVQAQAEELVKHDFVLRTKQQESEKQRERLKESEAQRLKAEAAEREAVAAATAAHNAASKAEAEARSSKAKGNNNADVAKALGKKERQDLEARIKQQETTIQELQQRLRELTDTRSRFEEDNNELARIVRELQARAQEAMASKAPAAPSPVAASPPMRRSTSFTSSARRLSHRDATARKGLAPGGRSPRHHHADDDLSTSSDEDDADAHGAGGAQDDLELRATVKQVVTAAFPEHVPRLEQSDETISSSIAQYENPTTNPMMLTAHLPSRHVDPQTPHPTQQDRAPVVAATELDRLRQEHAGEVAQLKQQYVTGLLEYKKLIIEQYERRQAETQQRHRLEIENLIMLVQDKFKQELERRGEKMLQAKESLKLLYRAMKLDGQDVGDNGDTGSPRGRRGGSASTRQRSIQEDTTGDDDGDDPAAEEPVPLKSLLRAAVFAMSNSQRRNNEATAQISQIYDRVQTKARAVRAPRVSIASKSNNTTAAATTAATTTTTAIASSSTAAGGAAAAGETTDWEAFLRSRRPVPKDATSNAPATTAATVAVACQVDERDFVIYELRGFRGTHRAPENVEGYVLPSIGYRAGGITRSANESNGRDDDDDDDDIDDYEDDDPDAAILAGHGRRRHHRQQQQQQQQQSPSRGGRAVVFHLRVGSLFAAEIVRELRGVLPFLPPGAYFLSPALRRLLVLEILRFYAAHSPSTPPSPATALAPPSPASRDVVVVVGSPRETPFMRRKATEAIERRRHHRGAEALASGGRAVVHANDASVSHAQPAAPPPSAWRPLSSVLMSHGGHKS